MQYSTIGLSLVLKRNPANVIFGIWKNGFWINSHTGIRNISYLEPRQNTKIVPLPVAKYGGRYNVTMMPGDGIGPEMMGYVQQVFRYAGVPVDFEQVLLNSTTNSTEDDFKNALITIKRNGVALKGSIESKYGDLSSTLSRNAIMRTELDLFANVIHCRSYPGIVNRHNNIDILLIRQNTEGEYSLMEHENVPGVVESLKIVTRAASERLARYAFDYARTHSRKKVTIVHKANIMKLSDGLFLESCKQISKEFPELEVDNMIIDNTCMQLVAKPSQFDVMVMPNLYGTVVTNLVCGLVGGPGLLSGCNYGDKFAVFEPGTRNTGTSVAGRNIANPTAMLNSSCDLLDHLDLDHHAGMIRRAVNQTINIDKIHTPDIGGQASSIDVVQNIIKCLQAETAVKNW